LIILVASLYRRSFATMPFRSSYPVTASGHPPCLLAGIDGRLQKVFLLAGSDDFPPAGG
jgi:hypothetical protein